MNRLYFLIFLFSFFITSCKSDCDSPPEEFYDFFEGAFDSIAYNGNETLVFERYNAEGIVVDTITLKSERDTFYRNIIEADWGPAYGCSKPDMYSAGREIVYSGNGQALMVRIYRGRRHRTESKNTLFVQFYLTGISEFFQRSEGGYSLIHHELCEIDEDTKIVKYLDYFCNGNDSLILAKGFSNVRKYTPYYNYCKNDSVSLEKGVNYYNTTDGIVVSEGTKWTWVLLDKQ